MNQVLDKEGIIIQTFDSIRTREARAVQIWQILIGSAHNRQTITYKRLSKLLGYKGAGIFAQLLDPIMCYCRQNQLPPLTILVVNEQTDSPGEGLSTIENENEDRERVFNFEWYNIYPSSERDFTEALAIGC